MSGPEQKSSSDSRKLSLFDAVAMAIGGMVGGGIFAVLGQAVRLTGNAAWISFGLAGVLAFITGVSYSRLTLDFDEPGGSFIFVEEVTGPHIAGSLSWLLMLGYIFTISLYAYTFGAYGSDLFNLGKWAHPYVGCGIIAGLTGLNLLGVRESGIIEDVLVYGKVAILLLVCGVGFMTMESGEALPVFEHSIGHTISAAALIFVAYEGFQLLTYDYGAIENHERNLPRAVFISIPVVVAIYVLISFVTTGALTEQTITQKSETVLAYVARPILGRAGLIIVMVAAVFSTASAINATIFATARLAKRVSEDNQLPARLTERKQGGVPVYFVLLAGAAAMAIQFMGSLHKIAGFSSVVFLLVFSVVNLSACIHRSYGGLWIALPIGGVVGCLAADGLLVWDLYQESVTNLWLIGGIMFFILLLRGFYVKRFFHKIGREAL